MDMIINMVRQAASMVAKLFSAGEKYASALEHTGTFVDESAASFADEARHKRKESKELRDMEFQHNLAQRKRELAQRQKRVAPLELPAE